jgi:hypothetical protein
MLRMSHREGPQAPWRSGGSARGIWIASGSALAMTRLGVAFIRNMEKE